MPHGSVVVLFKPLLLVEHDFGDGLRLPGNDDVFLGSDDAACNRDFDKVVHEAVGKDILVVPEDNLVNELFRAVLPCVVKDKVPALIGEPSIVLVICEVIVQGGEPSTTDDAVKVIHQGGKIMFRYEDLDTRAFETKGQLGKGGRQTHLSTRLLRGRGVEGNERGI